jgi:hypothetical protein
VDIVNSTGNPAVAAEVAARLAAVGVLIGTITDRAGADASAVQYPAGQHAAAQRLAQALGAAGSSRESPVGRVTVVLGARDAAALLDAVRHLRALPTPAGCPAPAGGPTG